MTQLSFATTRARRVFALSAIAAAMLATMAPLVHAPLALEAPSHVALSA
jgi:hypothetical protein